MNPVEVTGIKFKGDTPFENERIREILQRNLYCFVQKDTGKPVHLLSVHAKESVCRLLQNAGISFKMKEMDKEYQPADYRYVFMPEGFLEMEKRNRQSFQREILPVTCDNTLYSAYEERIVRRMDKGEELSEDTIKSLLYGGFELERRNLSPENYNTWRQEKRSILKLGDRYFSIDWEQSFSEFGMDRVFKQPVEVKRVQSMTGLTEIQWVPVKEETEEMEMNDDYEK